MKGFVTVILFFLFAFVSIEAGHINVVSATVIEEVCTVQDTHEIPMQSINENAIIPLNRDRAQADMEVGDAHSLAHRLSVSAERMCRFSSIETSQFIKTLLRRMATRMANLTTCHTRVYDTSRSLSWDNACEHYIFGMRRILI